ncbi:MAG TPA: VWA domain-containing protein [Solirubrobacteraceae bacterium]|nr:VWA domain-containing protein [Solirubrobacteraceae bacterium]
MRLNTQLDVDVVAVEAEDRVSVLLELTAPAGDAAAVRATSTVQVVLDRSGSMAGERLDAALRALDALVVRLDPTDNFGLVCFDDEVQVAVPAGPLSDKAAVRALIASIGPGGMTNLSGGYLRGLQEVARVAGDGGGTLLLLSDGHANHGVTDHGALGGLAEQARAKAITTSTVGLGLDYDEALLAAIARGGAGNAGFAEDADTAGRLVAEEVEGLLERVAQAASLVVRPTADVDTVTLYNDLPAQPVEGGLMVELGDFHAGEERKLLLELSVPAMPGLGLAPVCELELRWTELPSLDSHTLTAPVYVNVVPGDQAAGRIPNPTVVTEKAFQEVQRAKREAADALRHGDAGAASARFMSAGASVQAAFAAAPMPDELRDELDLLSELRERAEHDDLRRTAKFTEADAHRKNRRRGR